MTEFAQREPFFSNTVIKQTPVSRFLAISKYVKDNGNTADRLSEMISFSMNNYYKTDNYKFKSALEILLIQIDDQIKEWNSNLFRRYKKLIESNCFEFDVPFTFMHGDFHNQNAIFHDHNLYMIDWEYSTPEGSILYDWWYLRRSLIRYKDIIDPEKFDNFCSFIERSVSKMNLNMMQFNAFGQAMHVIINLSRIEKRGASDKDVRKDMRLIQKFIEWA